MQTLSRHKCTAVACGGRNAHTLAATDEGTLWCWGDHAHGKLGVGGLGADPELLPRKLGKLDGGSVAQLECGPHFSVALTKDGKTYSWSAPAQCWCVPCSWSDGVCCCCRGKGENHRLGHDSAHSVVTPVMIKGLATEKIVQISAGTLNCLALSAKGEVRAMSTVCEHACCVAVCPLSSFPSCTQIWSWGSNDFHQQGTPGTGTVVCVPTRMAFHSSKAVKIATGSSHCFAILMGGMTTSVLEFTPVVFASGEDQLGASLVPQHSQKVEAPQSKQRPSLSKIVLSQASHQRKQDALGHILTALQIAYARDAIVSSLGGVVVDTVTSEQPKQTDLPVVVRGGPPRGAGEGKEQR